MHSEYDNAFVRIVVILHSVIQSEQLKRILLIAMLSERLCVQTNYQTVTILNNAPYLKVPNSMMALGFSLGDAKNPALQMRVRRRLKRTIKKMATSNDSQSTVPSLVGESSGKRSRSLSLLSQSTSSVAPPPTKTLEKAIRIN